MKSGKAIYLKKSFSEHSSQHEESLESETDNENKMSREDSFI